MVKDVFFNIYLYSFFSEEETLILKLAHSKDYRDNNVCCFVGFSFISKT